MILNILLITQFIYLHTVKWFQYFNLGPPLKFHVLLFSTNYSNA